MRWRAVALALSCGLVGAPGAPGAFAQEQPGFHDAAGDANYLNHQGLGSVFPIGEEGPDTRPASIDGADLVSATYQTVYDTVVERDADGAVLAVRYVPHALRVLIRTTGSAAPSFGPTVGYALWVNIGVCSVIFRMYVRGPLSGDEDPSQRAELRTRKADCPEGPVTYTEGITLSFDGSVATLEYPFESVPDGLLGDGYPVDPDIDGGGAQVSTAHRSPSGLLLGGPMIDLGAPAVPFIMGSDVPEDVDCVATPDDPACAGG